MTGKLIVCPTPIGNMEDMTERGKRALAEADLIAAEDTRHTLGLLNHLGIKTPMISCHQHNEQERTEQILEKLREGQTVVLVSDAGTPAISDPGEILVRRWSLRLCHGAVHVRNAQPPIRVRGIPAGRRQGETRASGSAPRRGAYGDLL